MKTKEELKEAIKGDYFCFRYPVCMACLDELRKQQAIDQHAYDPRLMDDKIRKLAWEGLQKNIVMDGDTMIDKGTGMVLDPEVDSTHWKDKF